MLYLLYLCVAKNALEKGKLKPQKKHKGNSDRF